MSKFKLTQTATEVQNILNNSLQKPTGLSKTELVGVGVNGQENIEIGDNLTLANGKLSAATGGGQARHAYSIFVRGSFHYEVYTTTDLHLEKRVFHQINDFLTNENYKEFHAIGKYPAAGYINDSKSNNIGIISQLEIMSGDRFFINYFNIHNSNEPIVPVPLNNQPFQIIQLY